ncbi:putative 39S ribosomal protein L45, mitochondrial [Chionoecetes opilio]|uniref:Putative 39S ribosomal protein L45, mitochondrial n=1 Tax=Chionoecetes opilio TaxID=41210 RepID=A0A8J5CWS6_CHIOP|nr:putative 39S ribosomal protein L45, mitochondrial [Chionoecetes opilio]
MTHTLGFMSLVAVYTPTEVCETEENEMFYAKLDSVLDQCPPRDTLIMYDKCNYSHTNLMPRGYVEVAKRLLSGASWPSSTAQTVVTLAVYDRFGRLHHGSEVVARDVLEYVVFEKHVANTYGSWRVHDKIIPDWMPPKQPVRKTYKVQDVEEEEETPAATEEPTEAAPTQAHTEGDKPAVAVA